ncbi:hypothetical protein PI124_g14874 [Phytophthora idaei]|nr:hypothetical protein PI124_g14874 [Phytophthora idaei]
MKLETAERLEEKVTKMALRLDSATVSDEDIDQGLELIKEVHAFLDQNDYDKSRNCAAVLGATGVGKSTVVSLLFGDGKLLVHHEDEYTRVLTAEKPLPGVNIQYGSLSKTLLPAVLHAGVGSQSVVVFDMPGTQDTRGPFAELVAHFVMKWLFANHKNVQFIIVATPPQERSQEVTLASTINRACAGGSNAVLVYTKCDADFDPRITTKMKAINPENRNIPAFTLPRPRKLDEEGLDYSSPQREMKLSVLCELTSPVKQSKAFAEFVPDSAQLLLRNFRNRSIEFARDALSQAFLSAYLKYNPQESRYTLSTDSELLNILENPDPPMFEDFLGQIQWLVPHSGSISGNPSVQRAVERLNLMEIWSGGALIRCKNEWFSTKCRSKLEQIKRDLNCLYSSIKLWTEDIPTVVLIGFKSVMIKVELRVWANVVIVNPEVFITKIDLSAEGQAPPPVPLCAKPGQNGLHGAPGRPGGNLTIICKELVSSQFVKRSKGQRGGDGQNAGDAIDGAGPEYHLLRFRTDLETLMNRLTSLKEWESVLSYLPVGIRLDERSKRDLPPDVGHMALTAAGQR